MLENGLGDLIRSQAGRANRIIDPFCGSGAVAWYAAGFTDRKVIAADLQTYSTVLARAVLWRTDVFSSDDVTQQWFEHAETLWLSFPYIHEVLQIEKRAARSAVAEYVARARDLCFSIEGEIVWNAYGGYYFSPMQALKLDALRTCLPSTEPSRSVLLAALISSASACSASPGHTAQPFQPTPRASKFIWDAWRRDPFSYCQTAVSLIAGRYAKVVGDAFVRDANELAMETEEGDLVIIDPPYSSVHYSRFYHVLETIARGECSSVEGKGRYPPSHERPRSSYSVKSESEVVLAGLLKTLADRKTTVILTFPSNESSNGLTGRRVIELAQAYFDVKESSVESRFSTLGGNSKHRPARINSQELVLLLN